MATKHPTPFKDALKVPEKAYSVKNSDPNPSVVSKKPEKMIDNRLIYIPETGLNQTKEFEIRMRRKSFNLHSDLPDTPMWTYDELHQKSETALGPTIETVEGDKVTVHWFNDIEGKMPIVAVKDEPYTNGEQIPQNMIGSRPDGNYAKDINPYCVVHLHGANTDADSDGWTDNVIPQKHLRTSVYKMDRAKLMWYHDHAMGFTRLNVYAGLAGLWINRDKIETGLGLPKDKYEIPLLIQDRNFDVFDKGNDKGNINGVLLHKVENVDGPMEFFGPYTLVNGTVWPKCAVEPTLYRLRIVAAANARIYALRFQVLNDDGSIDKTIPFEDFASKNVWQIGTDGGLLQYAVKLPKNGLLLAPAERADLIIDFSDFKGKKIILYNAADAPFDGTNFFTDSNILNTVLTDLSQNRTPYTGIMRFEVDNTTKITQKFDVKAYELNKRQLCDDCKWISAKDIHDKKIKHEHNIIALTEEDNMGVPMLMLRELSEPMTQREIGSLTILFKNKDKEMELDEYYMPFGGDFYDKVNLKLDQGIPHLWKIVNLTEDTHPFHVHLVQFMIVDRQTFSKALGRTDIPTYDEKDETKTSPIYQKIDAFLKADIDDNEKGWKDTIRINPGEMVSIYMKFDDKHHGRYMYHCHILEHEDRMMMRPFVVLPTDIHQEIAGGMNMSNPVMPHHHP
jgi:FtsP/CotA-like multicopper oxidase with cupredoxin domain